MYILREVQVKQIISQPGEASVGRERGAEVIPSTERRELSPSSGVHGLSQTAHVQFYLLFYPLAMQSLVCRSAALALPGTLLKLQILRPHQT